MAYDIFSQPTGPHVLISLFGDAAQAGARLGQEVPSPLTSGIEGAEQGYQYALQTTGEAQQNTIRDNQIQQLPVANQIQNAQAQIQQSQAQIAQQTAARDTANAASQTQEQAAQLTLETNQATQRNNLVTQGSDFFKNFQSATPREQADMYFSGKNAGLFAQNPTLETGILKQLTTNNTLTPQEVAQVNRASGHATIDDAMQKKIIDNQQNLQNSTADALNGKGRTLTSQIVRQLKVPEDGAPSSVDLLEAGKYQIDPETNYLKLDETGKNYKLTSSEDYATNKDLNTGKYIAVSNLDGSKGLVVNPNVPKDTYDSYAAYLKDKSLANGQQAKYAKDNFDRRLQGQTNQGTTQSSNVPLFNDGKGFGAQKNQAPVPQTPQDLFRGTIQKQLNLPDDTTKQVSPLLDHLYDLSQGYIQDPKNRGNISYNNQIQQTMKGVARGISDNQYNSTPAIQAMYTTSHVTSNNQALDDAASQIDPTDMYGVKAMFDSQKIESPQDLYYNNYGVQTYKRLFDLIYNSSMGAVANQQKRASYSSTYQDINKGLSQTASGNGG